MLKKLLLSASFLLASHAAFSQGVAINEDNSSAATSAILDIKSTTKGMLAPRMTAAQKTAIVSPATGLLIYQTDGTAGFYYYNGAAWTFINAAGQNGLNSLSRTTTESAGANCATGGIKVEYGLDINSNGTLDVGEENATLTKYVCNGATGAAGATGTTGAAGTNGLNSLSRTTVEAAGANCTNGGVKVEYGLDTNTNGTLDVGEVNATLTKYVCNGAAGTNGATGATGATGAAGQGVPVGGTAGQVLSKINSTNYNTQWVTPSGGGSVKKYKSVTTDITITNNKPSYVNAITIALEANKTYQIRAVIWGIRAGASSSGHTYALSYTGNANLDPSRLYTFYTTGGAITTNSFDSYDADNVAGYSNAGSSVSVKYDIEIIVKTTTAGNFLINTAKIPGETDNFIVKAGSYITAEEIAE